VIRKFSPCEGEVYIVEPLNPKNKKYRGERVRLVKYDKYGNDTEVLRLESEWHVKRNCYTKIDICDLRPEKDR
jgi:hypothetical protein